MTVHRARGLSDVTTTHITIDALSEAEHRDVQQHLRDTHTQIRIAREFEAAVSPQSEDVGDASSALSSPSHDHTTTTIIPHYPRMFLVCTSSFLKRHLTFQRCRNSFLLLLATLVLLVSLVLFSSRPTHPTSPPAQTPFLQLLSENTLSHLPLLVVIYTCEPEISRARYDNAVANCARLTSVDPSGKYITCELHHWTNKEGNEEYLRSRQPNSTDKWIPLYSTLLKWEVAAARGTYKIFEYFLNHPRAYQTLLFLEDDAILQAGFENSFHVMVHELVETLKEDREEEIEQLGQPLDKKTNDGAATTNTMLSTALPSPALDESVMLSASVPASASTTLTTTSSSSSHDFGALSFYSGICDRWSFELGLSHTQLQPHSHIYHVVPGFRSWWAYNIAIAYSRHGIDRILASGIPKREIDLHIGDLIRDSVLSAYVTCPDMAEHAWRKLRRNENSTKDMS